MLIMYICMQGKKQHVIDRFLQRDECTCLQSYPKASLRDGDIERGSRT